VGSGGLRRGVVPFRGRGVCLSNNGSPRPPFGFRSATLPVSLPPGALTVRRVRPHGLLRPSSSFGSGRVHRPGFCGLHRPMERDVVPSWTSRFFPIVPRKSNDSVRSLADFRVASRQGMFRRRCRGTSPATASHRVPFPFDGSGPCGFALGCHASGLRHLSGLVTRMAPSSPQ